MAKGKNHSRKEGKKPEARSTKKLDKIPVTLLSGFLGAGKTTLLKHILESNEHKLRIAVIVNDMASLNIDAALVRESKLIQTKQELISLQNGCICCTLRGDLVREISRIQQLGTFDYCIIESSGISEPMQVAESFCIDLEQLGGGGGDDESGTVAVAKKEEDMLSSIARLDTCVTVIDAREFHAQASSLQSYKERYGDVAEGEEEEGSKNIAALLLDQVEFANVLLVNKTDLVTQTDLAALVRTLKTLNPTARILTAKYGQVPLKELLNTRQFDMQTAQQAAGWLQSLRSPAAQVHSETEEYGVSSLVYRARRPFHPARLHRWVQGQGFVWQADWQEVVSRRRYTQLVGLQSPDEVAAPGAVEGQVILRSKGFCWVAGRDDTMGEWAQGGKLISLTALRPWYCQQDPEEWGMETDEEKEQVQRDFAEPFGDCRQEIVFIGTGLQSQLLSQSLDQCLLSDAELLEYIGSGRKWGVGVGGQRDFLDPLPPWPLEVQSKESGGDSVFSHCLVSGSRCQLQIAPGADLVLTSMALDLVQRDIEAVQVWMRVEEGGDWEGGLLATLRPGNVEQVTCKVSIPSDHLVTLYLLEVRGGGSKRKVSQLYEGDEADLVKVYVSGVISAVEVDGEAQGQDNGECTLDHDHSHGHDHRH